MVSDKSSLPAAFRVSNSTSISTRNSCSRKRSSCDTPCFPRTASFSMNIVSMLENEFAVLVDDFLLPVFEVRGHGAAGSRNDVGVHRGVVETEADCFLVGELRNIAGIRVAVAHAE